MTSKTHLFFLFDCKSWSYLIDFRVLLITRNHIIAEYYFSQECFNIIIKVDVHKLRNVHILCLNNESL